ncbi:LexA family transcriptional regulator [Methylorubrum populi]|uniref:LexA family transcriptional regulator n=1 Tax=Methylorubrum populi TaxID=223967 RepID=UPI000DB3AEAD|nr:S24 family peptidase [Methylorubrum populi]PZP69551.1 MAG: hypothetical protein DI590_12750 [Methylorubrum populi]
MTYRSDRVLRRTVNSVDCSVTDAADARDGFVERFKSLYPDGNLSEMSRKVGIGATTLAGYASGSLPRLDKLVQIARALEVHVEWLATGEGPRGIQPEVALPPVGTDRERSEQAVVDARAHAVPSAGMRLLPKLTVEPSAGSGLIPAGEAIDGYVAISDEYLREIGVDPRYAHVLRVSGRSMAPTINDKDVVIIDTSVRNAVTEGVYTLVYGEAVLIKRIRLLRDGGVTLVSDNKSEGYLDETVPRSELATLSIVGRVKGHIRAL